MTEKRVLLIEGEEDLNNEIKKSNDYNLISEVKNYLNYADKNKKIKRVLIESLISESYELNINEDGSEIIVTKEIEKLNNEELKNRAGTSNERLLSKLLNKKFNINLFPNGRQNFPDIEIENRMFDFKAVYCKQKGNYYLPQYSNAIESRQEIEKDLENNFKTNTIEKSKILNSFIIFSYYTIEDNKIIFFKFEVVPTFMTIKFKKDTDKFAIKSAGIIDETGNQEAKNTNVIIGLPDKDIMNYYKNDYDYEENDEEISWIAYQLNKIFEASSLNTKKEGCSINIY